MATPAQRTNTWTLDEWYDQAVAGTTGGYQIEKFFWAWGRNQYGELGQNNTNQGYSSPVQVPGGTWGAPLNGGNFSSVSENFMMALKTDGTLWGWGENSSGNLGLNNQTSYSSPKQTGTETTWNGVTIFGASSLATKTDGTLWGWGGGHKGQIGQNNRTGYSSPRQIPGTTWSPIKTKSGAVNILMATKTDGTLWVSGDNEHGMLGLNDENNRSSPTQIPGSWNAEGLWSGYQHLGAIKTDGTLWMWGNFETGGGGDNAPNAKYSSPKQVGTDTTWKHVTGGNSYTLALKTDGTLWSWGTGSKGRTGHNSQTNYSSPTQVGTDTTWDKLSGGGDGGRAVKTDGTLWSWGYNRYGQMGQNSSSSPNNHGISSPTQIPGSWDDVASNYNIVGALKI